MRRYFLVPCDKHKHIGHAQQQAASQASMDSAYRQPVWLPHSSLGFQRPVGCRSYHNKPCLTEEVFVTPQATISQSAIVACLIHNAHSVEEISNQRLFETFKSSDAMTPKSMSSAVVCNFSVPRWCSDLLFR